MNKTVSKCGQCKKKLKDIRPTRPYECSRLSKRQKTVARTYDGVLCHRCLRERIMCAFLIEEHKIVKVLKSQRKMFVKPGKVVEKKLTKPIAAAGKCAGKSDGGISAAKKPAQKSAGESKK